MDAFHRLRAAEGEVLAVADYQREFDEVFASSRDTVWKLERAQVFDETGLASWHAMIEGDWARSLALMEEHRPALTRLYAARPDFRRLRVVESPVTPYLQWEMEFFTVRAAAGEHIRVMPASALREAETTAPLPELVIFTRSLCYEVLYDAIGAHTGARRITDPAVVGPCLDALARLYAQGEELAGYHARAIAPLPPPRPGPAPA
ncbi:hypothetical protein Skr01_03790 [Sphaerisporangium krabiense]|uniref:DUF6879 domain-containing protein n=1 Tax=Sphaerisporangium krabiense TaxID=763782 RepID=A0A7W8Z7P9_9ACTN|nr:DUF6879 family protein [Sphaerisporangium krabiense]MBB5628865.1 hypothetical protein [Sphaerisporangium krabiense]GII60294.1 hypothetical protein Skr01_03790 [Sphaerisporangium krabiense]